MHIGAMSAIQIKDVPEQVHAELRRRAAMHNQSLQEYLLSCLIRDTQAVPVREVLLLAGQRAGGHATLKKAADLVRQDRDGRR
jgi:plasmid stability protein